MATEWPLETGELFLWCDRGIPSGCFRAFTGAASLKLRRAAPGPARSRGFRAFTGAASLKHHVLSAVAVAVAGFRAFTGAASLKRAVEAAIGEQSVASAPSPARPR